MKIVTQIHAPTALPPVVIGDEARMIRMECTHPHNYYPALQGVSIIKDGTREINYGNCIAAPRPDRITPETHWRVGSNDKNGVYLTTKLLNGVALFL
jgi:hypothetical protein